MKIIVTGSKGQLGSEVVLQLKRTGWDAVEAEPPVFDLTDADGVKTFMEKSGADGVVHCAAYTNVDAAETEKELCGKVNADGTRNLAEVCKSLNIKLLYIGTDYVFDGEGDAPFETDDAKNPLNYYGLTKLEGEREAARLCKKLFIVRTSWLFGKNGGNFVKTMLRLASEKKEIKVVRDQVGSPTFAEDLAVLLCEMLKSEKYGVYHATNEGFCSRAEFASKIMELSHSDVKITPVASAEYESAARRPANSRLSKSSLDKNGFGRLPRWEDALRRFLAENKRFDRA